MIIFHGDHIENFNNKNNITLLYILNKYIYKYINANNKSINYIDL